MNSPSLPIPSSSPRRTSSTTPTYPSSPLRPIPIASSAGSSSCALADSSGLPSASLAGSYGRRRSLSGSLRSDGGGNSLGKYMGGMGGVGSATGSAGFVGSYNSSLLSFRFSTSTSPPLPFRLSISVLGLGPSTPPSFKCPGPPHLILPFTAHFFPLSLPTPTPPIVQASTSPPSSLPTIFAHQPCHSAGPSSSMSSSQNNYSTSPRPNSTLVPPETPASTPYLASVSLPSHFLSLLSPSTPTQLSSSFPTSSLPPQTPPSSLPSFPGYALPPKGQLQFLVSNATGAGVKIFLVPFDVRGMPEGTRIVIRQNTYERVTDEGGVEREVLRGSVSLKICSPARAVGREKAARRSNASSTRQGEDGRSTVAGAESGSWEGEGDPEDSSPPPYQQTPAAHDRPHHHQKYYLHSSLRLIFSSLSSSPFSTSAPTPKGTPRSSRFRTVTDLGDVSAGDGRWLPYEAEEGEKEYERLRRQVRRKTMAVGAGVAGGGRERNRSESRGRKINGGKGLASRVGAASRGRKGAETRGGMASGSGSDSGETLLLKGTERRAEAAGGEGIVFAKRRPPSLGRKGGKSLLDLAAKAQLQSHRLPVGTGEKSPRRSLGSEKEGVEDVLGAGLSAALRKLDVSRDDAGEVGERVWEGKELEEEEVLGRVGR